MMLGGWSRVRISATSRAVGGRMVSRNSTSCCFTSSHSPLTSPLNPGSTHNRSCGLPYACPSPIDEIAHAMLCVQPVVAATGV